MKFKFRSHPSKLSTLAVTFGAGARVEYNTEYPNGIAHYMEHVRFKGTKDTTAKEILREVAKSGGFSNAWTSEDLVSYHITIPEENIETAFKCLSDITIHPIFPEEELEKEKQVVFQEIRTYNDEMSYLTDCKIRSAMFSNSMAQSILGTEDSVGSINKDHIKQFNKEFYNKENMLVTLVSGKPSYDSDLLNKYFGSADDTFLFPRSDRNVEYGKASTNNVYKKDQLQDHISLCFGGPIINSIRNIEREKIKVFSSIFGGSDVSRLFSKIREDLGLVYGISSSMNSHFDGSYFEIYTITEPENKDKVIEEIHREINEIKNNLPSDEEVEIAKNIIRSSFYSSHDTSHGVNIQLIHEEAYGQNTGSEFLAKIDSVTKKDVNEIANIIFDETEYMVIGSGE